MMPTRLAVLLIVSMSMSFAMEIDHKLQSSVPVEEPEHKEKMGKFYFDQIREKWSQLVCKIGLCFDQEAQNSTSTVKPEMTSKVPVVPIPVESKPPPPAPEAKPAEKPEEKPTDKPAEKPEEKPTDKPAEKTEEKPAEKPEAKPEGGKPIPETTPKAA